MPVLHLRAPEQAREDISPYQINVTSMSPVGDISVVTRIRTDTTLDHSQKGNEGMVIVESWKILLCCSVTEPLFPACNMNIFHIYYASVHLVWLVGRRIN